MQVPRPWAILDCFPRPQAVSWIGSGAAGLRTGAHSAQGEDFNQYAIVLGPPYLSILQSLIPEIRHILLDHQDTCSSVESVWSLSSLGLAPGLSGPFTQYWVGLGTVSLLVCRVGAQASLTSQMKPNSSHEWKPALRHACSQEATSTFRREALEAESCCQ